MLYSLLPDLAPFIGIFNVTRYITFRTAAASLTALAISLLLGPWVPHASAICSKTWAMRKTATPERHSTRLSKNPSSLRSYMRPSVP